MVGCRGGSKVARLGFQSRYQKVTSRRTIVHATACNEIRRCSRLHIQSLYRGVFSFYYFIEYSTGTSCYTP